MAVNAGFGIQADIRPVRHGDARYMTKQLTDDAFREPGARPETLLRRKWFRPASFSRGWAPSFRAIRDEWRLAGWNAPWTVVRVRAASIARYLEALGYTIAYCGP